MTGLSAINTINSKAKDDYLTNRFHMMSLLWSYLWADLGSHCTALETKGLSSGMKAKDQQRGKSFPSFLTTDLLHKHVINMDISLALTCNQHISIFTLIMQLPTLYAFKLQMLSIEIQLFSCNYIVNSPNCLSLAWCTKSKEQANQSLSLTQQDKNPRQDGQM